MKYEELKVKLKYFMDLEVASSDVVTRFKHLLFITHTFDRNVIRISPENSKDWVIYWNRSPIAIVKILGGQGAWAKWVLLVGYFMIKV